MIKLNPYEILSHIIPGFIVFAAIGYFYPGTLGKMELFPSIAVAFLFGYYVNILSSYLESFYFWTWGGKPSSSLLEGKKIWKVNFFEHQKVMNLLKADFDGEVASNDALFGIAWRVANSSSNERVREFNSSYAVSRGILTCMIVISGLLIFSYPADWKGYLIGAVLIWASWLRAKQRAAYYAREVLSTYLTEKSKPVSTPLAS